MPPSQVTSLSNILRLRLRPPPPQAKPAAMTTQSVPVREIPMHLVMIALAVTVMPRHLGRVVPLPIRGPFQLCQKRSSATTGGCTRLNLSMARAVSQLCRQRPLWASHNRRLFLEAHSVIRSFYALPRPFTVLLLLLLLRASHPPTGILCICRGICHRHR